MGGRASVILVMGFAGLFSLLQFRISQIGSEAADNMVKYHDTIAKHAIAVAGANVGLSLLYQDPSLRGYLADDQSYNGGSFTVRFDSLAPDSYLLRSISRYRDEVDTVAIYLSGKNKQTFSIFAYMTLIEGNIWWVTGDTVWGRMHTNDRMQIYGSPVFMEKVTNVGGFNQQPGKGNNKAIFKDGFETGVAPIDFPTDLSELKNSAQTYGFYTTDEVWVRLDPGTAANNDGKIRVYKDEDDYQDDENPVAVIDVDSVVFSGVFFSTKKIHLQGKLDGRLTIASGDDVYLDDNVMMERNPISSPSDDLLGLVSEKDIFVTDNEANNDNIEIHATMFTRTGSFQAENYDTRPPSGIIKLIGGLVQVKRGPVGTGQFVDGKVKIKSGFLKRYYYDDRLADPLYRPPSFPGYWSRTLRVVSWWE